MADRIKQFAAAAVAAATNATKTKYFTNSRKGTSSFDKGENFELKVELNSERKDKKKDAVKKVIANMTVGKDVSSLFADVLKCMQTDDLELKKLVYLYLMNYAKSQPELVILADTEDPNPLIRALAIRTMGCIRVDKMVDYLCEPLRKALHDENPYVRKTAAICVAKMYDLNPTLADENGLLTRLQAMLSDSNPMVISNVVAALSEIQESLPESKALVISSGILTKLLAALNECTEWGQIFILDALAEYIPKNEEELESIVERVVARLQHANGSVVLSAVKILMIYLDRIRNEELKKQVVKKLSPPLATLLSSFPEVQYVALRNINLILQKNSEVLANEIRIFFCKYNDPLYVKLEKLEVIIKLVSENNIDHVLTELKEYASECDVEFVRKSIKAIGKCAIRVEKSVDRCIAVLLDLIKTKVDYVVQESVVVVKDIFRKFPNRFEGIIPILCDNLETLTEPEAKASMIWIIGEFAEKINNSLDLLIHFSEAFEEESLQVQLQLLTAAVKLYLKKPNVGQNLVQKILQTATKCDNADLRDRSYIYWRLLSSDPQVTKDIVLSEKPGIVDENVNLDYSLLNLLIANISTLSSVFHMPPNLFVSTTKAPPVFSLPENAKIPAAGDENIVLKGGIVEDLLDLNFDSTSTPPRPSTPQVASPKQVFDLLSDDLPPVMMGEASPSAAASQFPLLLSSEDGHGLEIRGAFENQAGRGLTFNLCFQNNSSSPLSDFAIQFNKNSFGLMPAPLIVSSALLPSKSVSVLSEISFNPSMKQATEPINLLQIAIKNNAEVLYFQTELPFNCILNLSYRGQVDAYTQIWNNSNLTHCSRSVSSSLLIPQIVSKLKFIGVSVIESSGVNIQVMGQFLYSHALIAADVQTSFGDVIMTAKSSQPEYSELFLGILEYALSQ